MGTFHDNLGELHGITVAVDTTGDQIMVGRCHEANEQFVHLLDVDIHQDGTNDLSKADWLRRAARWGVFPKEKVLKLPREQVASITPLGEVETG